jgi:lipoprotein-anchoring transpeptidase ErfK/SrfK
MPKPCTIAVWVALLGAAAAVGPGGHAAPATVTQSSLGSLPALRTPLMTGSHFPPPILPAPGADAALAELQTAMKLDVPGQLHLSAARIANLTARAQAMLTATNTTIDAPQLVLTVDRNPASQTIAVFLARPNNAPWSLVGATHVSTGQAGRKDYYITPVGVFRHTDAILDFRAQGTYNEHHVRGLGLAGMRVWDFGWQWALKGWHTDGEGGDIRLQMHATDPTLLERRLGRPASEGCVRVSSAMNRFLDHYGVLDADYDRVAITDIRYRQLLQPDHTPTPLAGRLLIVVDSRDPIDEMPTAASRPPNWPPP